MSKRTIVSPGISGESDYDDVWGNVIHTFGKDIETDKAWSEMLLEQKRRDKVEAEESRIKYLREESLKFKIEDLFKSHLESGKLDDFTRIIKINQLESQIKTDRTVYLFVGIVFGLLLPSFAHALIDFLIQIKELLK